MRPLVDVELVYSGLLLEWFDLLHFGMLFLTIHCQGWENILPHSLNPEFKCDLRGSFLGIHPCQMLLKWLKTKGGRLA